MLKLGQFEMLIMFASKGYFSSLDCPYFMIELNCIRPYCHYVHPETVFTQDPRAQARRGTVPNIQFRRVIDESRFKSGDPNVFIKSCDYDPIPGDDTGVKTYSRYSYEKCYESGDDVLENYRNLINRNIIEPSETISDSWKKRESQRPSTSQANPGVSSQWTTDKKRSIDMPDEIQSKKKRSDSVLVSQAPDIDPVEESLKCLESDGFDDGKLVPLLPNHQRLQSHSRTSKSSNSSHRNPDIKHRSKISSRESSSKSKSTSSSHRSSSSSSKRESTRNDSKLEPSKSNSSKERSSSRHINSSKYEEQKPSNSSRSKRSHSNESSSKDKIKKSSHEEASKKKTEDISRVKSSITSSRSRNKSCPPELKTEVKEESVVISDSSEGSEDHNGQVPHSNSSNDKPAVKVRIAHVPNVSSFLNAKQRMKQVTTKKSLVTVKHDELKRKPFVTVIADSCIPMNVRQSAVNNLYDELAKFVGHEKAAQTSLTAELEVLQKVQNVKSYKNLVALLVMKVRKSNGRIDIT